MYTEILNNLTGEKLNKWNSFLERANLKPDNLIERTVIIWDADEIIATASRYRNILKFVAVNEKFQGEGLLAKVITELKNDANTFGIHHLFLYTKPANEKFFSDLFFYTVAKTDDVVLTVFSFKIAICSH